ncbi:hypothetical protein DDB_G0272903 [Dictyostelium discoideum AX4]|uniref:Uncharacterized protein n=1 Tax=Dictyostelium discoideum TaxID=44689 RepID=Q556M3_DICDI|nr:hypothetical protein DDB_G0273953 [Dictyostelium discoideum AX4]XP_645079.2 hypothetical protein DDB_G0272903 [Dictyostelium discoideum AX4]EAL70410.2 hypothetical protein DDB_G0273953 [Dictyostelium discoideum AX4]EAL71089.2 hypothetical protein DDB_G0272903 [Dictyostelium discoideum AX4]|eukprot:XP_644335.2 hypothetical protein DDB_G0273953 [Dictyostelium discoideum AX4]
MVSNNDDLFFKIFRNQYINREIFNKVKEYNKKLKYIRYNYYDLPLELIIKKKNQQLFVEKLKDFLKLKNEIKENGFTKENQSNVHKYFIRFDEGQILLLLGWKELDLESFDLYLRIFENEIKNRNEITLYINPSGFEICDDKFIHFLEKKTFRKLIKFDNIVAFVYRGVHSIRLLNYFIDNCKDLNSDALKDLNNLYTIFSLYYSNGKNEDLKYEYLKRIKRSNQYFSRLNSFTRFIEDAIRNEDLKMLKSLLSLFKYDKKQTNPTDHHPDDIVTILDIQISIKILEQLKISINSFRGNDKLLPFYKILIERVYSSNNYFKKEQKKRLTIASIEFRNYAIDKMLNNGFYASDERMFENISFASNCINDDDPNNLSEYDKLLLKPEFLSVLFYKCKIMNRDLNLFKLYLVKFGFNFEKLLTIIELNYENMVSYVISNLSEIVLNRYLDLIDFSLPSNESEGYDFVFNLVLPLLTFEETLSLHEKIQSIKLPFNSERRRKFILKSYEIESKIDEINRNKINQRFLKNFLNRKEILIEICNSKTLTDLIFCNLKSENFKTIKKIKKLCFIIDKTLLAKFICSIYCDYSKSLLYLIHILDINNINDNDNNNNITIPQSISSKFSSFEMAMGQSMQYFLLNLKSSYDEEKDGQMVTVDIQPPTKSNNYNFIKKALSFLKK